MAENTYKNINFKNIIPITVTLFIFFILFSKIHLNKIIDSIISADYKYIILAIIVSSIISALIGTDRFRLILKSFGYSISFSEAFLINLGSLPFSVLPSGKLNLLSQIIYLKKHKQISYIAGVNFILFSLFLSLLAMFILIIISTTLCIFTNNLMLVTQAKLALFLLLLLGIGSVIIVAIIKSDCLAGIIKFASKKLNINFEGKLTELRKIYSILTYRNFIVLLLYSMFYQYLSLVVYYFLAKSLSLSIPFIAIILLMPIVIIFANIPVTIAGLGIRESLTLYFFAQYGSAESILSLGILFSLSEYIIPSLIGLAFTKPYVYKLFISHS